MTYERRLLRYATLVLKQRFDHLAVVGPATDDPREAREQQKALALAADILRRPYYEVSPFI